LHQIWFDCLIDTNSITNVESESDWFHHIDLHFQSTVPVRSSSHSIRLPCRGCRSCYR
jgi:hypothetical protein